MMKIVSAIAALVLVSGCVQSQHQPVQYRASPSYSIPGQPMDAIGIDRYRTGGSIDSVYRQRAPVYQASRYEQDLRYCQVYAENHSSVYNGGYGRRDSGNAIPGAIMGAIAGSIIGGDSESTAKGAMVGLVLGAVTGPGDGGDDSTFSRCMSQYGY